MNMKDSNEGCSSNRTFPIVCKRVEYRQNLLRRPPQLVAANTYSKSDLTHVSLAPLLHDLAHLY